MIDLSICTANLNTRGLLEQYLKSLYDNTSGLALEVIVVDNGSTDGSVEMLQQQFPQVRLIQNPANIGVSKAYNQAFRAAQGRYVACLNTDIIVQPGALATMLQFLEEHLDVGAVGCKLLNGDGSLQYSCGHTPTVLGLTFQSLGLSRLFPRSKFFARFLMTYWDHDEIRQVDQPAAACFMMRRETLEQVGLFDERFFVYFEDVDWCYRAKLAGWPIYFLPHAQVIHLGGRSSEQILDVRIKTRYESQLRFFQKYHPHGLTLPAMRTLILGEMFGRSLIMLAGSVVSARWKSRARTSVKWYLTVAAMCLWGTWLQDPNESFNPTIKEALT
jgi:GT2 family glycosyltransferase